MPAPQYVFVDEWIVISIKLYNYITFLIFLINYTCPSSRKSDYLHFNALPCTSDLFKNLRSMFNWECVGKILLLKTSMGRTTATAGAACHWHTMCRERFRRALGSMAPLCCCSGHQCPTWVLGLQPLFHIPKFSYLSLKQNQCTRVCLGHHPPHK